MFDPRSLTAAIHGPVSLSFPSLPARFTGGGGTEGKTATPFQLPQSVGFDLDPGSARAARRRAGRPALRWVAMIRGLDQLRVQGEQRWSFLEVCTSHLAITLTRLIPEILSHPGIVISGRTSPYASCRSMGPVEAEGEDDV